MKTVKGLGKKIETLCKTSAGKSIVGLAQHLSVSRATLNNWISSDKFREQSIPLIAEYLNVDLTDSLVNEFEDNTTVYATGNAELVKCQQMVISLQSQLIELLKSNNTKH